jgi:hypothetical protein
LRLSSHAREHTKCALCRCAQSVSARTHTHTLT